MNTRFLPFTEQELIDAFHADPNIDGMGIRIEAYDRMPLVREAILLNVRDQLLKAQAA